MEVEVDLATINDEEELRRMWLQAEDFGRKKEIRQHLYNLREARLADYYHNEDEPIITSKTTTTIMSSTTTNLKSPLTPSHGDSLADQSYQSFKSKEIRDSESPAPELKFIQQQKLQNIDGVIVPDTSGWNIQSSKEVAPDGSGFRNETLATTEGIRYIDGGQAQFAGKNEHIQKATHHGDDKNFVKTAGESSNTHLQESSVTGDENSGRVEKKSSSVITSSSKHFESKQSFGDGDFDDHFKNLSLEDKLRMTRRNNVDSSSSIHENQNQRVESQQRHFENQEKQQYVERNEQVQRQEQIQRQQKVQRQEQIEHQKHIQEQHRNVNSVSSNIDERYLTTVKNTDGSTYKKSGTITEDSPVELQNKLKELQAQPGRLISRKIEHPKPNVVMIIETKELPDGTVVTTKNYETTSANTTKVESKERQQKVTQESREFGKISQQKQQTTRDEVDRANIVQTDRRTNVGNKNEREIYEAELRNEQERDWKRGTDTVDRNMVREDVEVFDTHRTVKKDLSQSMRKQNISHQDFIETERGCIMTDRNQQRPERYIVETNDSTDRVNRELYSTVNDDNVRSKPDFTTHGFPSVVSGKSTNERVEHQNVTRSDVRPSDQKPKLNKQPSEHFRGTHGFPSVVDRSDTVSETSEHYETRSETVERSSQDFTTHGFPSVRSPTTESRPAAGKPSYGPKTVTKDVTEDFRGTHGFPSVVDRDNNYSQTEQYSTRSEVQQNMSPNRPAAGKPSFTKTVVKEDIEDFRGTHGFPSVVEKKTQNVQQRNVEKKVVETEFRSSTESLSRQKKTDAAHDAFARSLRCQSPVDSTRRGSTSSRNRYSPDRENSVVSDSSRYSSNTMTKGRGSTPTKKTKEVYHSNETVDLPHGGVQKNSTSKTHEEYTGEPIKKIAVNKLNRVNKKPFEPKIIKEKFDDRFVGLNEVIEPPIIRRTMTKLCPDGCPLPKQHNGPHVHGDTVKSVAKQSTKSPMFRRQLPKEADNKSNVITKTTTTTTTTRKPVNVGTLVKKYETKRIIPTKKFVSPTESSRSHILLNNRDNKKKIDSLGNQKSTIQTKRVIPAISPIKKIPSKSTNLSLKPNTTTKHTITVTSHYLQPTESSRHHIEDVIDSTCKNAIDLTEQHTTFKPTKSRSPSPRRHHHYLDATESTKNRIKKTTENFLDVESRRIPRHENIAIEIIDFTKTEPKHSIIFKDNFEENSDEKFSKNSLQHKHDLHTSHSDKTKPYTLHGPIPNKSPDGYVSKKVSIELTKDYKDIDDSKVTYPNFLNKDKTAKDTTKSSSSNQYSTSTTRFETSPDGLRPDDKAKNTPNVNKASSPKPKTNLPYDLSDNTQKPKGKPDNIFSLNNDTKDRQTSETIRIESSTKKNKKPTSYQEPNQPESPMSGSPTKDFIYQKLDDSETIITDLDREDKFIKNVNIQENVKNQDDTNFNKFTTNQQDRETIRKQYIPRSMVEEDYPKTLYKNLEKEPVTEKEPFYLTNPERIDDEPEHLKNAKPKAPFNRSETFEERCRQVLGINESTVINKNIDSENFISTEKNYIEENRKTTPRSVSPTYDQRKATDNQNKERTEKIVQEKTTIIKENGKTSARSESPIYKQRSVSPDYQNKQTIHETVVKHSGIIKDSHKTTPASVSPTRKDRSISPKKNEGPMKVTTPKRDKPSSDKKPNAVPNLKSADKTGSTSPKSSPNSSPERSPKRNIKSHTKQVTSINSTIEPNRVHHITSARIEITPPKVDNVRRPSKPNTTKKTPTRPQEKNLKDKESSYESDRDSPFSGNEETITTKSVTVKTTKKTENGKKPVTERKESAPVFRKSKIDHDQKMSRSTSDGVIKTHQNNIKSPTEQRKISEKKDLKNTIRPQKCLATKTITVTNRESILNSADIENVIIDIQQAKSSREPSPNKIVPVPVPFDEDTGLPRYPDNVQDPEDDKRKSKIKKIPIFEEETNDYVGCQITEVDNEVYIQKIKENKNITSTDQINEGGLVNVREKVTKFMNKAEETQKPKSAAPFNLDRFQNESEEEDDYHLSVNDKVNKFLSTAEELTRDIITFKTKEIFDSKQDTVNTKTTESEQINKFSDTNEKLFESVPQKSPELVKKIVRQISQQNDIVEITNNKSNIGPKKATSPTRTSSEKPSHSTKKLPESKSKPISKNENVKKAKSVFQTQDIKNVSLSNITTESKQRDILSRPSVWEGKQKPKVKDIGIDKNTTENTSNYIERPVDRSTTNNSSVTNNVIKKKNIFESYSVTSKNDISSKAQNVTDRLTSTPTRESRKPLNAPSARPVPKSSSPTAPRTISSSTKKTKLRDETDLITSVKSSHSTSPSREAPKSERSPTSLNQKRKSKTSPTRITETYTSTTVTKRGGMSPTRESLYYGEFGDDYNNRPHTKRPGSPSKIEPKTETSPKSNSSTYYSKTNKQTDKTTTSIKSNDSSTDRKRSDDVSPNRRSSKTSPTRSSKDEIIQSSNLDDYLLISKKATESSVSTRKQLFERPETTILIDTQKPSYMDHTKASLEHIRRDSLEISRNNYNRKISVEEEYSEGNPRSSVKFGVELKHKEEGKPKRKTSSPEIPHIEEIFDLELLEEMLNTVVGYEHRRRIRAQIRVVKNLLKQRKQEEAQIAYIRETSPARRSSPSRESTPTITSSKRKQSTKSSSSEIHNESFYTERKVRERSISPRTKVNTVTTITETTKIGNEKPKVKSYTTTKTTTVPSTEKPVWASKNILKKSTDRKVIETTKKSTPISKPKSSFQKDVEDCVTSSYGIGPTDDEGKPLFGIRALKKKANETNKVTGTVVSESLYSENGQEPVGQRTVTVYSSEPKDIDDYESKHRFRTKNDSIQSTRSQKGGVTSVTSTQKYSGKSNILDDSQKSNRGSIKEMSEKFIRKESSSSVTEKSTSSTYPNVEYILENEPSSKHVKEYYATNDDRSESECESVNITKTINKSTKSFLNSAGSKVTGVSDILDRMRNADNVVEDGDTLEDQEARALLNKFLGASVLMSGMESSAPSSILTKVTTEIVNAPTSQEQVKTRITKVIKTEGVDTSIPITLDEIRNIEEIWDEELLKELLEKSTSYEDRRKIRARLRQLMAEREACTDYIAGVKAELQKSKSSEAEDAIDSDSSYEYEEIIEEIEVTDSEEDEPAPSVTVIKTQTTPAKVCSPTVAKPTTASTVKPVTKVVTENKTTSKPVLPPAKYEKVKSDVDHKNEGDKLLPLLQGILNKNIQSNINNNINNNKISNNSPSSSKMANLKQTNGKSSNSRQLTKNNVIQHYIEDSGTESGEDLRLLAAGLRDSMQSANNNSNLIEEVTMALSRLEKSLKKGKDIEVDQMKRVALLNLVERLQTGLTSPDKMVPPTPVPTAEEESDQSGARQRFAKRKNRANRHTVGVSREELADARRYMEEMVMRENLSNCATPESSSIIPKAESSFPIQKQNSAIIVSKTNEQSKLYRPNQFVPNNLKGSNPQDQFVQMREKKFAVVDGVKRNSAHLEQTNNSTTQNGKRPLSESYAPNFSDQFQNIANSNNRVYAQPISIPPQHYQSYVQEPSKQTEMSEEYINQNAMSLNRFNKKAAMKRANTIDIPKPMKYLSEMDSDSEAEEHGISSTKTIGLRGTVQVSVKNKPKQVVPAFQPKTENDLKFLAFIQKQGPSPSLGWNNPNRTVNNWTNKFSNLKNSFESSASNTSGKPPVPNSTAKNFWKKNEQIIPSNSPKPQGIKPPWADKNYSSDVLTSSLRTKELNEIRAQQIAHIPKPIPLNKFSHATQSVFKPVDLVPQVNYQQQQFKPIQPDPRLHQSEPQLNQSIYYSERPEAPPNYTWTTLTSAPNSPHTVPSPTKNWFNKTSAPASPNPTNQLPWSTKNRAANRIRDKAEKYDKRSPPPVKLHRHNSLRSNQQEEKMEYKRPSLPNAADPFHNPPYQPQSYHLSNPQLNYNLIHHQNENAANHSFLSNSMQNQQIPQQQYQQIPQQQYQHQNYQTQSQYGNTGYNQSEINNTHRHYREDSLTNPCAEPLVLTNWNPTFNTDTSSNHQAPLTIFDYPSPIDSLASPNRVCQDPLESLTSPSQTYQDLTDDDDTENIEYKAETRVMTGPVGQQAVTIVNKTKHISDDILHGKNSNAADSLLSVMKNINGKSTDIKKLPKSNSKSNSKSPKTCLSPDGRNYIAPNVEAVYPDFSIPPQNRMPTYNEVQSNYKVDKPTLLRLNSLEQRNLNRKDPNPVQYPQQLPSQLPNQNINPVQYYGQSTNTSNPVQFYGQPNNTSNPVQFYEQPTIASNPVQFYGQPTNTSQMSPQIQYQPLKPNYPNVDPNLRNQNLNSQYYANPEHYVVEENTPKFDPNPAYEPPKHIIQSKHVSRQESQTEQKVHTNYESVKAKGNLNMSEFQGSKMMKTTRSKDAVMIESHQLPNVLNQQTYQSVQPKIQSEYTMDSQCYSNIEKNLNQHRQINKTYKKLDQQQQMQEVIQYKNSQNDKISNRANILAQDAPKSGVRQDKPSKMTVQPKKTYQDLKPTKKQAVEKLEQTKLPNSNLKAVEPEPQSPKIYQNTNMQYLEQEKSFVQEKSSKIRKTSKEINSAIVQKQNIKNNEFSKISEKIRAKELQTEKEVSVQNEIQRKAKMISQRSLEIIEKSEYKSSAPEDTPDIVKSSLLKDDIPILKKFGPPQRHHYTPNCYKTPLTKSDSSHELKSSAITRKYSDPAVAPEITETPATPLPSEEIPKNIVFNNIAQFTTMSRRLSETSTETKFQSTNSNRPNPLSKSDSWHQICLQQQLSSAKPPSPKFGQDENGHKLRRAKSGHSLAIPKMYEAGLKVEEASEKQKTVAAYFSGQKSPNSLSRNPSSSNINESNETSVTVKRSTINRIRTSEKTSISNPNPSSGLSRSQTMPHIAQLNLLDETNVDDAFEQLLKAS